MICVSCHRQVNKQRGKKRHVHTHCLVSLYADMDKMRLEISKREAWQRITCKVKRKYQWMMEYPPMKLRRHVD